MKIKLVLPLPPSDNRRFIIPKYSRRLILSTETRNYINNTGIEICNQLKKQGFESPLIPRFDDQFVLEYIVYLKDKKRDGSNIEKTLKDTLTGVVYSDDKWVCIRLMKIEIDKENPRVELSFDDYRRIK